MNASSNWKKFHMSTVLIASAIAIVTVALFTSALVSSDLKATVLGLPSGYVDNYTLGYYMPSTAYQTTPPVYGKIFHQTGGDLFYIERPEVTGNQNCNDDGFTVTFAYPNGSTATNLSPVWEYDTSSGWCKNSTTKLNLGKSMYIGESTLGFSINKGSSNFNGGGYGSPTFNQTYWTSWANDVEMSFVAYYTRDLDGDGVGDNTDNCSSVANSDQKDTNSNGVGDVCEMAYVTVKTSSSHPAANRKLYEGQTYQVLAAYDFQNTSGVPAGISSIQFMCQGCTDSTQYGVQFANVKFTELNETQVGPTMEPASNGSVFTLDLSSSPLQIPANSTKTLYLKGNLNKTTATSDNYFYIELRSATGVSFTSVSGTPVYPTSQVISRTTSTTNGSTSTTSTTSTTSSTSTTSTPSYQYSSSCTNSTENGLQCSVCKDSSGVTTSKSCWSSNMSSTVSKSCDYSVSSEGLYCTTCKDTSGVTNGYSCMSNTSTYNNYSDPSGDTFYSTNDRYTKNATCTYPNSTTTSTGGGNWCEICTQSGVEVRNTCNSTSTSSTYVTPATTSTTTTYNNGTTSNYYASTSCENSEENGLQCSTCKDSTGALQSKSCWTSSTNYTNSYTNPTTSCDYYTSQGLYCMSCKDSQGKQSSQSCWKDQSNYTSTYGGGDAFYSTNDRYTKGGHCDYKQSTGTASSSNGTTSGTYSSYGSSNWCEVCSIAGKEVKNSCSTNSLNVKEVRTLSNYCEYVQDPTTGKYCNICYGSNKEVSSKTCDEKETNGTISTTDLASQVKNMNDSLKFRGQDLLQFSRFASRIVSKIEDYKRVSQNISQDIYYMSSEGIDTSEISEIPDQLDEFISALEDMKAEVTTQYAAFKAEIEVEKAAVNSLSTTMSGTATFDSTDAAWLLLRRGDKFQALRDIYEGQLAYYELMDNYLEWNKEKAKVLARLRDQNIDIDSAIESDLDRGMEIIGNLDSYFDDYMSAANDVKSALTRFPGQTTIASLADKSARDTFRGFFETSLAPAWNSLRDARDTMTSAREDISGLWSTVKTLYSLQSKQYSDNFFLTQVNQMRTELTNLEAGLKLLSGKVSKTTQAKVDEMLSVTPQAAKMLADMSTKESGNSWEKIEKLRRYLNPRLQAIIPYIKSNLNSLALSDAEKSTVKLITSMTVLTIPQPVPSDWPQNPDNCMSCSSTLTGLYGSDFATQLAQVIKNEILNEVVSQITSALASSLAQYLDNETTGKVLNAVIANLDKLKGSKVGDDLGTQILENNTAVLDEISTVDLTPLKTGDFTAEYRDLDTLYDEFQELPMPDEDVATQVKNYWEDVQTVVSDPTEEDLQALVAEGQGLLDEAEESKYAYHLGFRDVPYVFDDSYNESTHWYSGYVVEGALDGRWEGYKDAEGNPTYTFGPSDRTLRAEALKMVLATFGYSEGSTSGTQNWWGGWQAKGKQLGLSLADMDLSQPISREEVARLIFEAGEMNTPANFSGDFPDVGTSHDWKAIEATYDAGIFTGDSGSGTFRPGDTMNRAESAAVINRAAEWQDGEDFVDEDLYTYLPLGTRIMTKISSVLHFFKVSLFGL